VSYKQLKITQYYAFHNFRPLKKQYFKGLFYMVIGTILYLLDIFFKKTALGILAQRHFANWFLAK
jgi:hypothetical protein